MQNKGRIGAAQPQTNAAEQPVSQVLAQHAVSVSAGEPAFRERDPGERQGLLCFIWDVHSMMTELMGTEAVCIHLSWDLHKQQSCSVQAQNVPATSPSDSEALIWAAAGGNISCLLCAAELWRILSGGRTAQQGQPAPGTPGSAGQPVERGFRSLSNPAASGLMFRRTALLPNPFAQLSSLPLRAKLPDLANLQKKPGRRRGTLPDLTEVHCPR